MDQTTVINKPDHPSGKNAIDVYLIYFLRIDLDWETILTHAELHRVKLHP